MGSVMTFSQGMLQKFKATIWPMLMQKEAFYSPYWKIHSTDSELTNIDTWLQKQLSSQACKDLVSLKHWDELILQDSDECVREILIWVQQNVTYESDMQTRKMDDYWQTVDETLQTRTGDCEDGAILIVILSNIAGLQIERMRLQWGKVVAAGHCYVVYYRGTDGAEVTLDWCYWYTPVVVWLRKWIGDDTNYISVWGTARPIR